MRSSMELTECAIAKRRKKWKKKRRLKRLKKRLREREVRFNASRWMAFPEYVTDARQTLATGTMQADAFWKNYAVAQEWQKRHSITWWRSRCIALEHENKLLRDKVRSLAQHRGYRGFRENYNYRADNDNDAQEDNDTESDTNEDLEFNVTEDLLNFFETSERHKREMRLKRESSETEYEEENLEESFVDAAESTQMKKDEADLLQGDAGSKILAMETTPQSTIEQYEDTAN